MLVCHQDSPVRQNRKMLKIPFSHIITERLIKKPNILSQRETDRRKAKTEFLMKYLNVGSSTSI
jgi:hypothetical protein